MRSLYRSGIIRMKRDAATDYLWAVVAEDLQWDFSLHQALSLYLVETIDRAGAASRRPTSPTSSPWSSRSWRTRRSCSASRSTSSRGSWWRSSRRRGWSTRSGWRSLEEVTHPKPLSDFIYGTFNRFRGKHPWVGGEDIKPKSIGREMFEGYMSFADYVKRYSLQRSEGVLLRYLSQLYKTLDQTVPEPSKTEGVWDALGFFRALVEQTDSSLLEEWQGLLHPEVLVRAKEREDRPRDPLARGAAGRSQDLRGPRARRDAPAGPRPLAQGVGGGAQPRQAGPGRSPDPLGRRALRGRHGPLLRGVRRAPLHPRSPPPPVDADPERPASAQWDVTHTLLDPQGDNLWAIQGTIDLRNPDEAEGPIVRVERISS